MTTLEDFLFSLKVYGYAYTGHLGLFANDVRMAESRQPEDEFPWDHDRFWLTQVLVSHGDAPAAHPPESWALPAVAPLLIRREQEQRLRAERRRIAEAWERAKPAAVRLFRSIRG